MNIALLTDSTSDIAPAKAAESNITIVPLYVNFRDAVFKDQIEITVDEIFQGIREGAGMPSTSQPTPADFENAFERLLQTHDHVFAALISSKLSGTLQSAELAARRFAGRVTTFDSRTSTVALWMMVERAGRMFAAGASIEQVVATLEKVRARDGLRFCVSTLEFLRRNGRIGGAQAFLGGLLNIKPILRLQEGHVEPAGRARGNQRALAEVEQFLKTFISSFGRSRAGYLYTEKPEDVAPLCEIGRGLGIEEFVVTQCGPVLASHVGPGTYGVFIESLEI